MVPQQGSEMHFSGPFEGVELVFLVKYRDDAQVGIRHYSMGTRISKVIGIKTLVGELSPPDGASERLRHDKAVAHSVPVYAE